MTAAPHSFDFPTEFGKIVSAVRRAVPTHLPVSAKLRLGWDDVTAIHANAECAAEGGAAWITIHARTKEQGYRPPAYWKPIAAVRACLRIPVVANGEIWTVEDLRRCRGETGCEHFMLGRGALANPALARSAALELGVASMMDPESTLPLPADWVPLVRRFVELSLGQDGRLLERPHASSSGWAWRTITVSCPGSKRSVDSKA